MELPKIYNFIDNKYIPVVRYLLILPPMDIISFLKSLKNKTGFGRDFHGYEFENDEGKVEFWDTSSGIEQISEITVADLLDFLEPLIFSLELKKVEEIEKIKLLIQELGTQNANFKNGES